MTSDDEAPDSQGENAPSGISGGISVTVTDLFGIGKASEKFSPAGKAIASAFNKCVGVVADPAQTYLQHRAENAARRHEILADAKAITKVEAILSENPALSDQMKVRLITTELRRQNNIQTAAKHAIELAEEIPQTDTADEIEEDFMVEWIEGVKDVSNEYVRKAWSKILAHAATTKSGRVSKPALDLLKQLDYPTAKSFDTFIRVYQYVGPPASGIEKIWMSSGVDIDFQLLKELGLIERWDEIGPMDIPGLGRVGQTGKMLKSNLGLSALPKNSVWAPGKRAIDLANALFAGRVADDQKFGYKTLRINLDALSNDPHQHLFIKLKGPANTEIGEVLISHPENRFTTPHGDGTLSDKMQAARKEIVEWLKQNCSDLDDYIVDVLCDFASEGRLQATSNDVHR